MLLLIIAISAIIGLIVAVSKSIRFLKLEDTKSSKKWAIVALVIVLVYLLISWIYKKIVGAGTNEMLGDMGVKVRYKVIKQIDAGSGFIHDKDGKVIPFQSLAPKVGDIITAPPIKEIFIFNKNMNGTSIEITSPDNASKSELFIPAENLKQVL